MKDFAAQEQWLDFSNKKSEQNRVIIRIRTTYWNTKKGLHSKKDILFMKKISEGFNFLQEECLNIGPEEVFTNFSKNLWDYDDGLYEVCMRLYKDSYTGEVDLEEFYVIPYIHTEKQNEKSTDSEDNSHQMAEGVAVR